MALALAVDFEVASDVETYLDELAVLAVDDPLARNALYEALAGKIARFCAQLRPRAGQDYEDLEQDAFLVFVGLVADWPPERGPFLRYFLGFFPWRLRHVIEGRERLRRREACWFVGEHVGCPVDVGDVADPESHLGGLTADELLLVRLRAVEGRPLVEIAPLLGWSRRTAYHRWRVLRDRLAAVLAETIAVGLVVLDVAGVTDRLFGVGLL